MTLLSRRKSTCAGLGPGQIAPTLPASRASPPCRALVAVAVARPPEAARTRTFWRLIAFGLAFFLFTQLWHLSSDVVPTVSRREDLLFLGRYLFLIMVLEIRPDSARSPRSEEQLRLLDTGGAVLFLFALISYVLVSPPFYDTDPGSAILPTRALPLMLGIWLLGLAVLRAVLREHAARADAAAVLVISSLGLAAAAMMAGSALLFELGLALAAAVGGFALWLWPVVRIAFGASGAIVAALAWLSLMQATALLTESRPVTLLLMAAVLLLFARLRIRRPRAAISA